jgi:hypothetical protein
MADATATTSSLNLNKVIQTLGQTYLSVQGQQSKANITGNLVVLANSGRIGSVCVTTLGNATGMIYDSNSLTNTTLPIYVIANSTSPQVVNMPVNYGILVVPSGNMTLAVSYSLRTDLPQTF